MEDVSGSGERRNVYADVVGPTRPENQGVGNRLEVTGDPTSCGRSNGGINPLPEAQFFVGAP
jgi:hypothetical protein